MRKISILTDKEERFLVALAREKIPFIIVGLTAATLQGAIVVTQDIDLWIKDLNHPRLKQVLKRMDAFYVPPTAFTPPMFAGDGLTLFDIVMNMDGLDSFDREWKRAKTVRIGTAQVKVLPLERIIKSKETANRSKDKLTLKILRDTLIALKEAELDLHPEISDRMSKPKRGAP